MNTFTINDALEVQQENLRRWRTILNDRTFALLSNEAKARNINIKNPYDVFRGTDMDNYVHNIAINNINQ
jgi:hypothetical protein